MAVFAICKRVAIALGDKKKDEKIDWKMPPVMRIGKLWVVND